MILIDKMRRKLSCQARRFRYFTTKQTVFPSLSYNSNSQCSHQEPDSFQSYSLPVLLGNILANGGGTYFSEFELQIWELGLLAGPTNAIQHV